MSLLILLLAAIAAPPLADTENEAAGHRVFQFALKPTAMSRLCRPVRGRVGMALPLFRSFRADGAMLFETSGYNSAFYRDLKKRVKKGKASRKKWSLDDEVADFVAEDGTQVLPSRLPQADATFVEYWAEWCAPCKAQIADLKRFTEEVDGLNVNVLLVEADPQKLPAEMARDACAR